MLTAHIIGEPILLSSDIVRKRDGDISDVSVKRALHLKTSPQDMRAAHEWYLRTLIENCATRISIPGVPLSSWMPLCNWKESLAPTIRRRVRFVDRTDNVWETVAAYFRPIKIPTDSDDLPKLLELAWSTYLVLLGFREGADVPVDIRYAMDCCHQLALTSLTSEASARIANIQGLFRSYGASEDVPTLSIVRGGDVAFAERIDDIVNDAHFLEVSVLRQTFGVAQNRTALRRDMRKLVAFIARNKRWAVGLLRAGSSAVIPPAAYAASAVTELFESRVHAAPLALAPPFLGDNHIAYKPRRRLSDAGFALSISQRQVVAVFKQNGKVERFDE